MSFTNCVLHNDVAWLLVGALAILASAPAPAKADTVPQGLTASDWSSLRQVYAANRHAAFAVPGGHQARNHGQQWLTRFDGRGFEVKPDDGDWRWGLQLESFGRAGRERAMRGRARVTTDRQRVSYEWGGGLREWWVNEKQGLEHGFTINQRPSGEGDVIVLRLSVRGGLHAHNQQDGRGVSFVDGAGRAVVNYAELKVWDADGRVLRASVETLGAMLRFEVQDASARYPLTVDPIAQQAYLKASNANQDDAFGSSIAVSGDTVVVGAAGEDSSATGVNANQSDNSAVWAGAAYVFVRSGGAWTQQAYLKASNTDWGDVFGWSVAVSGDTIVVGARYEQSSATGVNGDQSDNSAYAAGAAYVFVRSGGVWTQQAYLKAPNTGDNDNFGYSVAVSGDTVVVGAFGASLYSGAAFVFGRNAGVWRQQAYLKGSNPFGGEQFGTAVSVSGATVVVGAPFDGRSPTGVFTDYAYGAAYVFVRNGGGWTQQSYLKASNDVDLFAVAVSVSGDTIVVGAWSDDSGATGVNGNPSDTSTPDSGAAYIFVRSGGAWTQQAYLKASNTDRGDQFGGSVAVSGDTVVVGAPWEASAATGVNGNQNDNSAFQSGAAYVFVRSGGVWRQQAYLKSSNSRSGDVFGWSVAVSGNTVVVCARDQAAGAGAAYVFVLPTAGTLGDVNGDGIVNCADIAIIRSAFGTRTGLPGWDPRADVVTDGIIDIRDLAFVSQKLPLGTRCP